jgi:hypothetical protein
MLLTAASYFQVAPTEICYVGNMASDQAAAAGGDVQATKRSTWPRSSGMLERVVSSIREESKRIMCARMPSTKNQPYLCTLGQLACLHL